MLALFIVSLIGALYIGTSVYVDSGYASFRRHCSDIIEIEVFLTLCFVAMTLVSGYVLWIRYT